MTSSTGLRSGAIGLREVLFQSITAMAPGAANVDRIAKEGAMFTSWYGQASCTAGRSSFITGRIPIRSAL